MKPYKVTINGFQDRALAARALERCPIGYRVTFSPPVRSFDQNSRLWAFLDDIAEQKDWEGKKRTSEQWKDLFTACLRQQEIVRGIEGGLVAFGARTSEMSPSEMSDLLQLIETWGVQNGVQFKDSLGTATEGSREPENTGAGGSGSRTTSKGRLQ